MPWNNLFPSLQLIELRRNPQGSIDKRIRATLRPMSKTRRDSSFSELEERLKEVSTLNNRFRKMLTEKENELQVNPFIDIFKMLINFVSIIGTIKMIESLLKDILMYNFRYI